MARYRVCLVAVLLGAVCCMSLLAQDRQADEAGLPPRVLTAEPADRAVDVDFRLREIKVTFDRPMRTGRNHSWMILREHGTYPGYEGSPEPRWENDGRTCVLPVRLSPDTLYAVGINSYRHTGFRDAEGRPAVPYAWVFRTKGD